MPPAVPPPDTPPLPEDLAVCQQMIRELLASLHAAEQDNAHLRHRLDTGATVEAKKRLGACSFPRRRATLAYADVNENTPEGS